MIGKYVKRKYPGLCKAAASQSLSSASWYGGLVGGAVFHRAFATLPLFYFSQGTVHGNCIPCVYPGEWVSCLCAVLPWEGDTDVLALLLSSEGMSLQWLRPLPFLPRP